MVRKALDEYAEIIQAGKALGVLGHHHDNEVPMSKASHLVEKIEEVPEGFTITSKTLDTPYGRMLEEFEDEVRYGLRGTGGIKTADDGSHILTNIKIISIDLIPKIEDAKIQDRRSSGLHSS